MLSFDIGIMPLQDDLFSRGKCSFKAIYCMAHGVPVVISPVGMNCAVVAHGESGFFAITADEWTGALSQLIEDAELRGKLGRRARQTIVEQFDAQVVADSVATYISGVAGAGS